MLAVANKNYGKVFDYRKMIGIVKQLGRPLTEKEAEQFRIK